MKLTNHCQLTAQRIGTEIEFIFIYNHHSGDQTFVRLYKRFYCYFNDVTFFADTTLVTYVRY